MKHLCAHNDLSLSLSPPPWTDLSSAIFSELVCARFFDFHKLFLIVKVPPVLVSWSLAGSFNISLNL